MLLVAATLQACSFIPTSGPTGRAITHGSEVLARNRPGLAPLAYALVRLDAATQAALPSPDAPPAFESAWTQAPQNPVLVGVGDVLSVAVFESGSGGLFIPADAGARAGNFVQIPSEQVEASGTIDVPYAGRVPAAGHTVGEIQAEIARRLAARALEPQVVVTFSERHANEISVLGEVNLATRFSLDPSGERVLGAIARAAGPKYASFETLVTVQRDGRAETALLSEIAKSPAQNFSLAGGDVVYVAHEPRYFLGLGATGATSTLAQLNRRFAFGDYNITLADGLALAGGLEDDRATAKGVFLYRQESQANLRHLGLAIPPGSPDPLPTIYTVDLQDPGGFFLAGGLWMRDHDTIFVSNAPLADLTKVLNLLETAALTGSYSKALGN